MNATKQSTPMSSRARRERLADAYESLREGTRFTQAAADYLYRVDGHESERDGLERLTARLRELMETFRTEAEAIDEAICDAAD